MYYMFCTLLRLLANMKLHICFTHKLYPTVIYLLLCCIVHGAKSIKPRLCNLQPYGCKWHITLFILQSLGRHFILGRPQCDQMVTF